MLLIIPLYWGDDGGSQRGSNWIPKVAIIPPAEPPKLQISPDGGAGGVRDGQALSLPGAEILVLMPALLQGLGLPWGGKQKAEGGQTGSWEDVAGQ